MSFIQFYKNPETETVIPGSLYLKSTSFGGGLLYGKFTLVISAFRTNPVIMHRCTAIRTDCYGRD